MIIGKEFEFAASHVLPKYDGPCNRLHGHTFRLIVEIEGEPNSDERSSSYGMVMDFKDLKYFVEHGVLNVLDHSHLNDLGIYPTAENLIDWIWEQLEPNLFLHRIRLYESPTSYAERKRATLLGYPIFKMLNKEGKYNS